VSPKQVEVVANTPDEATLTLTTCHPKGSARQRLIVKATMVRSNLQNQQPA
jgi:sortase (surface protein transpeptidase)